MPGHPGYTIFPLGDSAVTIDFGNVIEESVNHTVMALFSSLQSNPFPGIIECLPAYSSLTVFYDARIMRKDNPASPTAFDAISRKLEKKLQEPLTANTLPTELIKIPVCYDPKFSLDMDELISKKNITRGTVIELHTSKTYMVYMLGFLPGFTYMGKVDEEISIPRKLQPRQRVEAGSVGIAGRQTGIYPLASPGGWQIIGRTPLQLFTPDKKELTLVKPGDTVQFYSISKDEFNDY